MKKLLSTLMIGALSATALVSTAPAFARGEAESNDRVSGNVNTSVQTQPVTVQTSAQIENETEPNHVLTANGIVMHVENEVEHNHVVATSASGTPQMENEIEVHHNRSVVSSNSDTTGTPRIDDQNHGRGRGRGRGRGSRLLNASTTSTMKLGELDRDFKVEIPAGTSATNTTAIENAVASARTTFLAAIEAARNSFRDAIEAALAQFHQ